VHVVPLSPLVRELIASVPGNGELVFTTDGRSPVSVGSKIKRRLDQVMNIPPWRLHDLRRTFVTGLAELGIRPDVIELAVNHISGLRGGIAGVYNRSELLPERRAALERWATHVQELVGARPKNVVSLRGRK
jgi:integrase